MAALLVLAAAPLSLHAQGVGLVRGVVRSRGGSTLQGARVSVQSPDRVALSDDAGRYVLRALPAGHYDLLITALGYRAQHAAIDVTANGTVTADATLEPGSLMLSSVITTATRSPIEASRVAATVNVLTPEQIATSPARETQDLLREIPGVELPRTSSVVGGTAQIVSIRGVDEGRTVVTADGIPINDAWGEWIDWSKLPKGMVDRVEVMEGGSSSLYGNGGIGGAIALFTRQPAPGTMRLSTDIGSRDSRHVFAAVGLPSSGPVTASLSGDYGDGGGYQLIAKANAGPVDRVSTSIRRNATARVEYAPSSRFSSFVSGHVFDEERELGSLLARTTRASNDINAGLNYRDAKGGEYTVRSWLAQQDEDQYTSSITTANSVARSREARNAWLHIPTTDRGITLQYSQRTVPHLTSLTYGADYRRMAGHTDENDFNTTSGARTTTLYSGGTQVLGGGFVQAIAQPITPVSVEASVRMDLWGNTGGRAQATPVTGQKTNTQYSDKWRSALSPRLGVRWQVAPALAFHTAGYRAFRAPNLAELYRRFNSGTVLSLPNPALKPEYGTGYEAGFDLQPAQWVQLKGTAYTVDMKDFNTFVTIATNVRQRLNVQQSRARGGEVYLALRPVQPLLLTGSVNYVDAKIVSGPPGTVVGQRVGRVPRLRQNVRATYTSPVLGAFTITGRHEGTTTTLQGVPLAPYTLFDAFYRRSILRSVSGFVAVDNITNEEYQVGLTAVLNGIASLGMPRTVRVGVDVTQF